MLLVLIVTASADDALAGTVPGDPALPEDELQAAVLTTVPRARQPASSRRTRERQRCCALMFTGTP
jgi:hypothetical protein